MPFRVSWRDLIYAVAWIVVLAVPSRYLFTMASSDTVALPLISVLVALAVLPGMIFTVWYVGRRKQP